MQADFQNIGRYGRVAVLALAVGIALGLYRYLRTESDEPDKVQTLQVPLNEGAATNDAEEPQTFWLHTPLQEESALHVQKDIVSLMRRSGNFAAKMTNSEFVSSAEIVDIIGVLNAMVRLDSADSPLLRSLADYNAALRSGVFNSALLPDETEMRRHAAQARVFYENEVFPFYALMISDFQEDITKIQADLQAGIQTYEQLLKHSAWIEQHMDELNRLGNEQERICQRLCEVKLKLAYLWTLTKPNIDFAYEMQSAMVDIAARMDAAQIRLETIDQQGRLRFPEPKKIVHLIESLRKNAALLSDFLELSRCTVLGGSDAIKMYDCYAHVIAAQSDTPNLVHAENLALSSGKFVEQCRSMSELMRYPRLNALLREPCGVSLFMNAYVSALAKFGENRARYDFLKTHIDRYLSGDITLCAFPDNIIFPDTVLSHVALHIGIYDQNDMQGVDNAKLIIDGKVISARYIPAEKEYRLTGENRRVLLEISAPGYVSRKAYLDPGKTPRPERYYRFYLQKTEPQPEQL